MSARFSLFSWLSRLPLSESCIDGDGRWEKPRYYALAEDWTGRHCPYPKLPRWCQRIFDARVRLAYWTHNRYWWWTSMPLTYSRKRRWLNWPITMRLARWTFDRFLCCYRRGYSWHFHCPACKNPSMWSPRGKQCISCQHREPPDTRKARPWSALRWAVRLEAWWDRQKRYECRWCGKRGGLERLSPSGSPRHCMIATHVQDMTTGTSHTDHACRPCYEAASAIEEYLNATEGYCGVHELEQMMQHYFRLGRVLPAKVQQYQDWIPF